MARRSTRSTGSRPACRAAGPARRGCGPGRTAAPPGRCAARAARRAGRRRRALAAPAGPGRPVEPRVAREGDDDPARGTGPQLEAEAAAGPVLTVTTLGLARAPREGRGTTRSSRSARPAPSARIRRPVRMAPAPKGTVRSERRLSPRRSRATIRVAFRARGGRSLARRRSRGRRRLAQRHLGAVGAARGRGDVAGPVDGVGAEQVDARVEVVDRDAGDQRRRVRGGAGLEFGRQLGPVGGVDPPVEDRAAGRPGVGVEDVGLELCGHTRPVGGLEGDPGGDVVEAQRHRRRGRGGVVAGLVAQPDLERVGPRPGDVEVVQRREVAPGGELDPGVVAGRAGDPPEGAADRAGRALVGVAPGEVEVVGAAPALAAGERQVAHVGRRVVVDQHGLRRACSRRCRRSR